MELRKRYSRGYSDVWEFNASSDLYWITPRACVHKVSNFIYWGWPRSHIEHYKHFYNFLEVLSVCELRAQPHNVQRMPNAVRIHLKNIYCNIDNNRSLSTHCGRKNMKILIHKCSMLPMLPFNQFKLLRGQHQVEIMIPFIYFTAKKLLKRIAKVKCSRFRSMFRKFSMYLTRKVERLNRITI